MIFTDFLDELHGRIETFGAYRDKPMPNRFRLFRQAHLDRKFLDLCAQSEYSIESSSGKAAMRYLYVASILRYGMNWKEYDLKLNRGILFEKKDPFFYTTTAGLKSLNILSEKSGIPLPASYKSLTVYDAILLEWSHEAIARAVVSSVEQGAVGSIEDVVDEVLGKIAHHKFFLDYDLIRFLAAGFGCMDFTRVDDFWAKSPEMGADLAAIFRLRETSSSAHAELSVTFAKICKAKQVEAEWASLHLVNEGELAKSEIHEDVDSESAESGDAARGPSALIQPESVTKKKLTPVPHPSRIHFDPFGKNFDMNQLGRCPNPLKRTHATMERAREYIAEIHTEDPTIEPYKCVCGGIHIGHPSQRDR